MANKGFKDFADWWDKSKSQSKTDMYVKKWIKANPPNEDDEPGGDHWHVNQMMHEGEANELCYEIAMEVFNRTLSDGEDAKPTQSDALYCGLDQIIWDAHSAALKLKKDNQWVGK